MSQVYGLLYHSTAEDALDSEQLQRIMRTARERNYLKHVTGQLHYENGIFLQWLEGSRDHVVEIFGHIKRDTLHRDIDTMYFGPVPSRSFDGWDMAYSSSQNASLLSFMRSNRLSLERRDATTIAQLIEFLGYAGDTSTQYLDDIKRTPTQLGVTVEDYVLSAKQKHPSLT